MGRNVERQIDIKKYFVYLVRYWWMAVLLAAIFGAVLGGIKYMKDKRAHDEQEAKNNQLVQSVENVVDVEERIERAKAKLDVVERQNVELAIEYYRLMQQYNKYKNSSVYLSQNPYKVNKTDLYFKVSLDPSVEGTFEEKQILTDDIVQAYVNYINSGAYSAYISVGDKLDAKYVIELVSAENNGNNALYGENDFTVSVINDSNLLNLQEEVKECINDYGADITEALAKHSIELVDEYNAIVVDNELVNDIQVVQTDIYNASTRLAALKKAFSDEQMMCYNDAIGVVDVEEAESETGDESLDIEPESVAKAEIQIKYIVIGMILGIAVYCCLILARFLFTSYVLAESGFQSMFGLRYIGGLADSDDENKLGMTAMKIYLACKKDKVQRVAVISSDFSNVAESELEALIGQLNKESVEAVMLESVLMDGKAMSELTNIGKCVFAERTGKTRIGNLAALVELCEENSVDMYGVVDFRG